MEINKTVQYPKIKMEAKRKTKAQGILKTEILSKCTGAIYSITTNRIEAK